MNGLVLKIIALITMIIDHYGAIFYNGVDSYRIIGRLAFPIYCFLLVEGFIHTKNFKKYAERLLIFALISELPFDLAFYGELGFQHQNIFFTLFFGLVAMYFLDIYPKYTKKIFILYIALLLATVLAVDYSFIGILYIMTFYFTKNLKKKRRFLIVGITLFIINLITGSSLQHYAIFALPILYLYNGKPGLKHKVVQVLFYAAYPLHLIVFYLINSGFKFL